MLSNSQMFLLSSVMFLPMPISWKLAIYNFFSASPISHLSPTAFVFLISLGPILTLLFLYFAVKFLLSLTRTVTPLVLVRFRGKPEEKKFLELTFPSDTGKSAYATEQLYTLLHTLARRKDGFLGITFGIKKEHSLEIVSTKNEGIRYILAADLKSVEIIKRSLLSFLPGLKIREIGDYLTSVPALNIGAKDKKDEKVHVGVVELFLSSDFVLPLQNQKILKEHDFISYLTGAMTRLDKDELISFQIVTTPVLAGSHNKAISHMQRLRYSMKKGLPIEPLLATGFSLPLPSFVLFVLSPLVWLFVLAFKFIVSMPALLLDTSGKSALILQTQPKPDLQALLNPYEQELQTVIKEKIGQHLFETSIRVLIIAKSKEELEERAEGLYSSFGPFTSPYQGLTVKRAFPRSYVSKKRLLSFRQRSVSSGLFSRQNPILSTSELSDIYHFPYTDTTKTEDIVKTLSPELPAPLFLKTGKKLDVIFARNNYGNSTTDIGLTDDERARHVYLLGRTGSGKSTIIYHMAKEDIQRGRGIAVIDPHGDLAEALLATVPDERINDLIYFNPFDLKYPIRINLLELPEGLEDDELELEKELVTESVISVFRRIFSKEEYVNAHRIEYILRNTIYTSFAVPDRTLFTIYKLLTNQDFRKKVVNTLDDENLKDFWNNEFGKASSWQIVKMISGVTAKVGRFLYSPTAKRIIEQPKSTISFDEILDQQKILICNLSEGKIGEDTAQVLGLTIIAKIHQAALRRARIESSERKPFYLFVDEFQNFATTSFTRILSGGRKFGLRLTLAEQSSAQQQDRQVVNVILANTGTVICFATASPLDEQMMESQFSPHVSRHDLTNLPKYRFYIKMSATNPEEPFSGETLPIDAKKDTKKIEKIIEASRKNYASVYQKPKPKQIVKVPKKVNQSDRNTKGKKAFKQFIPDDVKN